MDINKFIAFRKSTPRFHPEVAYCRKMESRNPLLLLKVLLLLHARTLNARTNGDELETCCAWKERRVCSLSSVGSKARI